MIFLVIRHEEIKTAALNLTHRLSRYVPSNSPIRLSEKLSERQDAGLETTVLFMDHSHVWARHARFLELNRPWERTSDYLLSESLRLSRVWLGVSRSTASQECTFSSRKLKFTVRKRKQMPRYRKLMKHLFVAFFKNSYIINFSSNCRINDGVFQNLDHRVSREF